MSPSFQVGLTFLILACAGSSTVVYLIFKRHGRIALSLFLLLSVFRDTILVLAGTITLYIIGRAVLRGTWLELGIALGMFLIVGTIENALEGVLTSGPPPMVSPGSPPSRWEIRRNVLVVATFGGCIVALNHIFLASASPLAIQVIAGINVLVMLGSLDMHLERVRKYQGWFARDRGMRPDLLNRPLSRPSVVSGPAHIRDVQLAEQLESRAFVLVQRGRFYAAYDEFDRARLIYEAWGMVREAAEVWCNLGMCHLSLGNYERALEHYRVAGDVFQRINEEHDTAILSSNEMVEYDMRRLATIYLNEGQAYIYLFKSEEAIEKFDRAQAIFEISGIELDVAELYRGKASGYAQLYRYDQALQFLDRARKIHEQHGKPAEVAIDDAGKATILAHFGYFERALDLMSGSKSVFAIHGLRWHVAKAATSMASLCQMLRRYDEALELCLEAEPIFAALSEESEVGEMGIATVDGRTERIAQRRSAKADLADTLIQRAAIESSLEQDSRAFDSLRRAETLLQGFRKNAGLESLWAKIDIRKGFIYFRLGDLRRAQQFWSKAVKRGRRFGFPVNQAYRGLGQLFARQTRWQAAYEHYKVATEMVERVRQHIHTEEFKISFFGTEEDLYMEIVGVCVKAGWAVKAIEWSEHFKSRTLLDALSASTILPPPDVGRDLAEQEQHLQSTLHRLIATSSRLRPGEFSTHRQELETASSALEETWREIAKCAPEYVALRRGIPLSFEEVKDCLLVTEL
jgi:tetratricopeptide (TPR) repeat protein